MKYPRLMSRVLLSFIRMSGSMYKECFEWGMIHDLMTIINHDALADPDVLHSLLYALFFPKIRPKYRADAPTKGNPGSASAVNIHYGHILYELST